MLPCSSSVAGLPPRVQSFSSNYNPYENYDALLPHKGRRGNRRFYEYKLFTGGKAYFLVILTANS